jgi:alpha-L-arabinofuranosidase
MSKSKIYSFCVVFLLLVSCQSSDSSEDIPKDEPEPIKLEGAKVSIDATVVNNTVSPMIQGHGLIYSLEQDAIYNGSSMADLYKKVGAGYLRYPGGTVTTMYHWNDLNGQGWIDSWNGTYNRSNDTAKSEYMDLDEYMVLCAAAEVEPMLGINMSSGRNYDRQEDGLNEAIELLKYCKAKNFDVKYLYLDNENHHKKWSADEYANQINYYAPALKEQMPNAKLIANWTSSLRTNRGGFATLINKAGVNFDYIDIHWYWKWENGSWDLWKGKTPMENETKWYDGGTYAEEIAYFKEMMTSMGKPTIKLASMEWNLGPGKYKSDPNHTPFRSALMQSEMQMQMIQGGLEIASLWSTQWPDDEESDFNFLVSSSNNYSPTPTAKVFELYKNALNGDLVQSSVDHSKIMSASVIKDNNKAYVYLLNKSDEDEAVYISLEGYNVKSVNQAICFKDPGVFENLGIQEIQGKYTSILKGNSLTMIELILD